MGIGVKIREGEAVAGPFLLQCMPLRKAKIGPNAYLVRRKVRKFLLKFAKNVLTREMALPLFSAYPLRLFFATALGYS